MMRRVFNMVQEPRGEVLHRLLRALAPHSSSVMMVQREDLGLSETGQALLSRLQPHLVERKQSSVWPGTTLLGEEATVLRFAPSEALLNELIAASDGLYGWRQPDLPEDLALMRDDETAILASICHEHDAYLSLTDDEYESLAGSAPELVKMLRLHEDR